MPVLRAVATTVAGGGTRAAQGAGVPPMVQGMASGGRRSQKSDVRSWKSEVRNRRKNSDLGADEGRGARDKRTRDVASCGRGFSNASEPQRTRVSCGAPIPYVVVRPFLATIPPPTLRPGGRLGGSFRRNSARRFETHNDRHIDSNIVWNNDANVFSDNVSNNFASNAWYNAARNRARSLRRSALFSQRRTCRRSARHSRRYLCRYFPTNNVRYNGGLSLSLRSRSERRSRYS